MGKTAKPQTVMFVEGVGCSGQCDYTMKINDGLDLPCKEWTNSESMMLRERMLKDNELMNSGFVRSLERSDLGNSNRFRARGIDVGEVRTQDSGASELNSCDISFNTVRFTDFEKEFYVVNTELNTKMCVKNFIGKRQQDLIGDQLSTYEVAEEFANTDLADIIIAKKIEKFQDFLPEFMLLASKGGSGRNLHGDDGIMAKAYYASKGQYFHTIQFDMSLVDSDFPNTFINAIVGGSRYEKDPSAFGSSGLYLLDFVDWLNDLQEKRDDMFNATIDLSTSILTVASTFVTRYVDLKIVLNGGDIIDWGCISSAEANMLPFTQIQERMLINDTPLLFQYEQINETNFFNKFKDYKKEFVRYMHRNGWKEISINDVLIGIDPELMLERTAYLEQQTIQGNFNAGEIENTGFSFGQFRPLNSLNNTGLFFMTIAGNLLQLSDGNNYLNSLNNMRIRESKCEGKVGEFEILSGVPPIGSEVEAWGVFAANLTDSWFVLNNKLDDRQPYKHTMVNLQCYDDNVKNECVTESSCNIESDVEIEVAYDSGADETTITVTVDASLNTAGTLAYNLAYSLNDGTGQTGITVPVFVVTLPGDQTNAGLVISVSGDITGTPTAGGECKGYVAYNTRIGDGGSYGFCSHTVTNNPEGAADDIGSQLQLRFEIGGNSYQVDFANQFLGLNNNIFGDPYASIEDEIEAILSGSVATVTGTPVNSANITNSVVLIENVPSFVTNIELFSVATGNGTGIMTATC